MTYEEITKKTNDIVVNGKYQEGDIFHEMYHSWIYILKVSMDKVTTFESRSKLSDFVINTYTKKDLSSRFRYSTRSGCWLDYHKNDINHMNDILDKYKKSVIISGDVEKIRDMNLNLILA
jgi:hypothetical protein